MAKRGKTQEVSSAKTSGKSSAQKPPITIEPEFKLNSRQSFFIRYYLDNGFNATRAYMKAYNSAYDTARTEASKLLANPSIQQIVKDRQDEMAERLKYTREKWLSTLVAMATSDVVELNELPRDEEGRIIHPGDAVYGIGCKASDRKAALDELRDVLGFKNPTDTGIEESTARDLLSRIRGRKK